MKLNLNFRSGIPVYLQIAHQIKAAAASGALRDGDALPSVRVLAEDLRINRNTAAKAYAELESEGVIETRMGKGCFLKASGISPLRKSVRTERISAEIDSLIVQARHLQIPDDELLDLLSERLEASRKSRELNAENHTN
jgi:GntR family transcriptional regulator